MQKKKKKNNNNKNCSESRCRHIGGEFLLGPPRPNPTSARVSILVCIKKEKTTHLALPEDARVDLNIESIM